MTSTDLAIGERRWAYLSDDGRYRYWLRREWDETLPAALFVMLNPSTADAIEDDPTIRRCRGFAKAWGCGGLVVANVFAYRATDPKALAKTSDPVGPENDTTITMLLGHQRVSPIVAAWGGSYPRLHRGRVRQVSRLLRSHGAGCLGKTSAGEPRHPLYVPAATALEVL